MKPQSAKQKGRKLQQQIVADLYETFPQLEDGDLRSTSMGCPGEDIQMSAAARRLIPYSFESKNQEKLNFWDAFAQCKKNCGEHAPVVVAKKNNHEIVCLVQWSTFLKLMKKDYPQNIDLPVHEQLRLLADVLEKRN
jgi:PHD/YefM family antitoxin component YafN of YafNO toxin-antitoxin module